MTDTNEQNNDLQTRLLLRLAPELPRRRPEERSGVIYHYTNQAGLLGILDSQRIWCTDIRFLSDGSELVYALELTKGLLKARAQTSGQHRAKLYRDWVSRLGQLKDYPLFVASFSQEPDLLSQWRAYCSPSGFAIGFTAFQIVQLIESLPVPGNLMKCVYDVEVQREHINYAVESISEFYEQEGASPEAANTANRYFFSFFLTAAACFKHPGFAEEKEWRLVLRGFLGVIDDDPTVVKRCRPGVSTVVPYVEFPLSRSESFLPVRIIVVGPCPSVAHGCDALRELIPTANLPPDVLADVSKVPYRNW